MSIARGVNLKTLPRVDPRSGVTSAVIQASVELLADPEVTLNVGAIELNE